MSTPTETAQWLSEFGTSEEVENRIEQLESQVKKQDSLLNQFVWGEDNPHEYDTLEEKISVLESQVTRLVEMLKEGAITSMWTPWCEQAEKLIAEIEGK